MVSPDGWEDDADLSEEDKRALEEAIAEYERDPDSGSPMEEVMERIREELRADNAPGDENGRD